MNSKKLIACALILTSLSGCATLFGEKNDTITINSTDPSATLLVNGNDVGKGSTTYNLPAGKTAIITASKHGCSDRSVPTQQTVRPIAWLDILFFPGFIIDAVTGALFKPDPQSYVVTPDCRRG
jgi:hypothetical protein